MITFCWAVRKNITLCWASSEIITFCWIIRKNIIICFEIRKILTKLGITPLGISYEVFPIRKNLIRNIITWFVRFFLLGKT